MGILKRGGRRNGRELLPLLDANGVDSISAQQQQQQGSTVQVTTSVGTGEKDCGQGTVKGTDTEEPSRLSDFLSKFGLYTIVLLIFAAGIGIGFVICELAKETPRIDKSASAPEGGACKNWQLYSEREACLEGLESQKAFKTSLYWLHRGDATMAIGNHKRAGKHYQRAIEVGSQWGAPAGIMAANRLAYLSLNCRTTEESLSRIGPQRTGSPTTPITARQISVADRQRALKVVGLYSGDVSNQPHWEMREAIMRFQTMLWFNPADGLSPEQTTLLICGAAQIHGNPIMQDLLGIMFATGQGVAQNTDSAVFWLDRAAQQGYPDAHFNLAIMYGTNFIRSASGLCDTVATLERADSYLENAARLGHHRSRELIEKYQHLDREDRWKQIRAEIGSIDMPELDSCGRV